MRLSELLSSGNFAKIVELFPPGLPSPETMIESQRFDISLRFERLVQEIFELEAVADAFSLPELKDGVRIHLNTIALASELEKRTGSDVIPTMTLRDSNKQGILGLISYAIFAGIENLQVVRGDPYGDSLPKNVYDFSKVSDLVTAIRKIESHSSTGEKMCILAPINMTKTNNQGYVETIKKRALSGVDIFVTDSFFEDTDKHLSRISKLRRSGIETPIIHNIFPFRDYKDAIVTIRKFGWKVPREELHGLKTRGPDYGLKMARKRYYDLLDRQSEANGVCISTRGNPELVKLIIG